MAGRTNIREENVLKWMKTHEEKVKQLNEIEDKIEDFYEIFPLLFKCKFDDVKPKLQKEIKNLEWMSLVRVIQNTFDTGRVSPHLEEEYMVLIPKCNKGFRGIDIVNTVWKLIAYIIKSRLQAVIEFHPCVHRLVKEKVTWKAIVDHQLWTKAKTELEHKVV